MPSNPLLAVQHPGFGIRDVQRDVVGVEGVLFLKVVRVEGAHVGEEVGAGEGGHLGELVRWWENWGAGGRSGGLGRVGEGEAGWGRGGGVGDIRMCSGGQGIL